MNQNSKAKLVDFDYLLNMKGIMSARDFKKKSLYDLD